MIQGVIDSVRGRYRTLLENGSPAVPTKYDNAPFSQPDPDSPDSLWVNFAVRPGEAIRADVGTVAPNRRYRVPGVAIAVVFGSLEKGQAPALALADRIAAVFLDQSVGGVRYRTPSVEIVGRSGAWWQINVNCPFQADVFA